MNILNCTVTNCTIISENKVLYITFLLLEVLTLIASGFSCLFSFIAAFVFVFARDMDKKFFHFLRFYTLNSMFVCINIYIVTIYFLTGKDIYYWLNIWTKNDTINSLQTFYNLPLWILTFTFSNLLEICILYERMQMVNLKLNFLRKVNFKMSKF